MSGNKKSGYQNAISHLSKSDIIMAELIRSIGECKLGKTDNYYQSLLSSIINQQLSGTAADSIYGRLLSEVGGELIPEKVCMLSPEQFRRAGVSRSKEDFIRRLSTKFLESSDFLADIEVKTDSEVFSILTDLKGVGRWTAQMFMIFSLNRLDVLPLDDAGLRRAVSRFYMDGGPVGDLDILKISEKWRPYRSIAVWYLWRSIDSSPKGPIQSQQVE